MGDLTPERLGKYEVLARLSVGGMAELFLGCLPGPGGFRKFVALKQILPDVRSDAEFVKMFLDEARISAALVHPNIGQVFELGEDENGELYLAMDFIAGQNLSAINRALQRRGARMPIDVACRVVRDVCLGLHAAHTFVTNTGEAQKIIHRDVSPKNVMVSYSGQVKVIDFGIAKAKGRLFRTQTGVMKGTLSYMAPEQALTRPVDARTDLFAVGVIFFELLTGTKLFAGADPKQAILNGKIVAPSSINPAVSPALDAVVLKAVERDPEQRFQTGRAFAKAITEAYPGVADDEDLAGFLAENFADQLTSSRELFTLAEKNRQLSKSQVVNIVQRLTMVDRAALATPHSAPEVTAEAPAVTRPQPGADDRRTMQLLTWGGLGLAAVALVVGLVTLALGDAPEVKPPPPLPVVIKPPVKDAPRPAPSDATAVLDAARRAQAAVDAEDWVKAEAAWSDVLLRAPNDFAALTGAGVALVEQHKFAAGLERLERAGQLAAINGATLEAETELIAYRARALRGLQRDAEAQEQLDRLRSLKPANERVRKLIAALVPGAPSTPAARPANKPPPPAPSPKAASEAEQLYKEASKEAQARNYERAALRGEKCIKIAPGYAPCYRMLGSIYARIATRDQSAPDMEKAKRYYERFLEIAPPGDEYVPKVRAILDQAR